MNSYTINLHSSSLFLTSSLSSKKEKIPIINNPCVMFLTVLITIYLIIIKLHCINNSYSLALLGLTPWEYSFLLRQSSVLIEPRLCIWTLDWADLALLISGFEQIILMILIFYFHSCKTQNISYQLANTAKLSALEFTAVRQNTALAVIAGS